MQGAPEVLEVLVDKDLLAPQEALGPLVNPAFKGARVQTGLRETQDSLGLLDSLEIPEGLGDQGSTGPMGPLVIRDSQATKELPETLDLLQEAAARVNRELQGHQDSKVHQADQVLQEVQAALEVQALKGLMEIQVLLALVGLMVLPDLLDPGVGLDSTADPVPMVSQAIKETRVFLEDQVFLEVPVQLDFLVSQASPEGQEVREASEMWEILAHLVVALVDRLEVLDLQVLPGHQAPWELQVLQAVQVVLVRMEHQEGLVRRDPVVQLDQMALAAQGFKELEEVTVGEGLVAKWVLGGQTDNQDDLDHQDL